jgi:hypothetical protein
VGGVYYALDVSGAHLVDCIYCEFPESTGCKENKSGLICLLTLFD